MIKKFFAVVFVVVFIALPSVSHAQVGGAAAGAVVGGGIGLLFGPVGGLVGAGAGALVGGLINLFKESAVEWLTSAAIYYVVYALVYLLGYIAAAVFYLGGFLVDFALNINLHLLESELIQAGWKIVLNFTNLGFVLAIIVIAFATIFQLQSYGMKQALWKLIVAALLVNFSLVIAGGFINISHIFTNYFNSRINSGGTGRGLADNLGKILNTQFFLSAQSITPTGTTTTGTTLPSGPVYNPGD